MKTKVMLLTLAAILVLTGCGSPFAPVVIAPTSVPSITLPSELPGSLIEREILWNGGVLRLKNPAGKLDITAPEDTFTFFRMSSDNQYMVYLAHSIIADGGLPKPGDDKIMLWSLHTDQKQVLVSKAQSFPDAVLFAAPTFTPDGKKVVFLVSWEHADDLVEVDLGSGKIQRLNTDVLITNFGYPDVSSQGQIVVICKGPKEDLASELCLLDGNGKFIRYLTSEGDPSPGNGLFTPNGQYVVYDSQYKLYKVRVDGSDRQQIAPCGLLSPDLVTDTYAAVACYVSQQPDCYALFLARLDGSDFRRIAYVEPVCNDQ